MIKPAKKSDYASMEATFRASATALCTRYYDDKTVKAWLGDFNKERYEKSAAEGNEQYVLTKNGEVICFAALNIEKQYLVSLFVSPDFSGIGVGKEMIEFLKSRAKQVGLTIIHLDSSLNAVNFYSRSGFKEKSRTGYKTHSGTVLDSVQMTCQLK